MKLTVWIVVLLALAAAGAWFWPPTGYGLVPLLRVEGEKTVVPSFRRVSAYHLAECHAKGLEGCLSLRTDERKDVTVMVEDGLVKSRGELLTEGKSGGLLRYLAVMSEFHDDGELAFYCAYGRVDDGLEPDVVAGWDAGSRIVVTTRLWWGEDGAVMRSYDEHGAPACRIHYVGS